MSLKSLTSRSKMLQDIEKARMLNMVSVHQTKSPDLVQSESPGNTRETTSLESQRCTSPTLFQWAEKQTPKTSQQCEEDSVRSGQKGWDYDQFGHGS